MNRVHCPISLIAAVASAVPLVAAEESIPLKRVVLFSSGVGYFQRDGEVNGDATVELPFKADQINDLLKSLLVQDLGGGRIAPITYPSRDPLSRTLKSFGVDIADNPTLGGLLNRLRGAKVVVTTAKDVEGMILGVEKQKRTVKDELIEFEVLNIVTADGLRAVPLEQVQKIKLLDEKLDSELRKALETLASGLDQQRKPVTLLFTGNGKRAVRVGYILETPVWKTSYRLWLDANQKPFMQGWAIVENTTDSDWKNVSLALVSGRPISFIQDLYQPLYLSRPVVVPELYSSLRPPVYEGEMDAKDKAMAERGAAGDMPKGDEFEKARDLMPRGRRDAMPAAPAGSGGGPNGPMPAKFNPVLGGAGVAAMAQAAKAGELFQYAIEQPVSIERQKSAMIPIVNQEVEAQKVSIYNESVQPRFPLNGLRLKNTTPLHLMQGPVTVFDGGVYAGDARIEDLQPKEERLIAYAMDLAVEVEPQHKGGASEITSVKIVKGTLIATHKSLREKTYHVKNRSDEKRILLIEHPFDSSWKLVSPEQTAERTQTVYRFRVEVEPRKSASLDVKEERVSSQQIALIHYDVDAILFYVGSKVLSAKAREALQKVVGMKMKLNDITSRRAEAQQEINNIGAEQARIRENMERLERHSELYARYVKKFDQQETQIESLRELIKKLTEDEGKQRKQLEEYLANLQAD